MTWRTRRALSFLAALAICGPAAMAFGGQERSPSATSPTKDQDAIGVETSSWGILISKWQVYSDDSGEFSKFPEGANQFKDHTLVEKRFGARQGLYHHLSTLLKPAERYAGKSLPCNDVMTDMPYGEIQWTRGGVQRSLKFNYGCQSDKAAAIYKSMNTASGLVDGAATDTPVHDETRP